MRPFWAAFASAAWPRELLRRKPALGFERRHAADSRRGDRLSIDVVGDVAGGEHAGTLVAVVFGAVADIAVLLDVELAARTVP